MNSTLILGIDPGLTTTGYGLIACSDREILAIESMSVRTDEEAPLGQRLLYIEKHLQSVLMRRRPCYAAIESPFVGRDPGAALKLGQVSGVCIATAARCGLRAQIFMPRQVKQVVCGSGSATKRDMETSVRRLVTGADPATEHEADGFGLALALAEKLNLIRCSTRAAHATA